MLKEGIFIRKRFFILFLGCLIGALCNGISFVLDGILSGNTLGETALSAVSIVAPLGSFAAMLGSFFAPGYSILYGQYLGYFDKKNAYKVAGQGLVATILISIFIGILMFTIKDAFLNFYGCTDEIYEYASVYYNWIAIVAIIEPYLLLFYFYLATDGDSLLMSLSGAVQIGLNVILSFALVNVFGISGLGMGKAIAIFIATIICVLHFFRKSNSFHFTLGLNFKNFIKAISLSAAISAGYLFVGLTDVIMNKIIIMHCGSNMIPVYAVINFVLNVFLVFAAVYNAANGFCSTFYGECNNKAVRNMIKLSCEYVVKLGLILSALLLICAPLMPKLYGLESPEVVAAAIRASRFLALETIPYGINVFMECIYPSFDKGKLGVFLSFLNDFLGPVTLSLFLMNFFEFDAVIFGMSFNGILVIIVYTLIVTLVLGKKGFPLYLDDYGNEIVSFDYEVKENSFTEIRDKVLEELNKRNIKIKNIDLLIEELYKRIYDKNKGKKVVTEITIIFAKDYTYIITRDDGIIFNFVDENNKIESLNTHVLNSLLETIKHKDYIVTMSCNRNGFKFLRDEE